MDLQSNYYEKISIKWTIIKRTVVRRTLFSCPKWTFCLKIISIKRTQVQKQFSRKKTYIFFEKLLFAMFYSLVYIFNNFFHCVFCPLNCFGWSKKLKIYRNLKSVTSTMIHTLQLQYILFWRRSIWLVIFEIKTFFISFNLYFLYPMEPVNFKDTFLIYFC